MFYGRGAGEMPPRFRLCGGRDGVPPGQPPSLAWSEDSIGFEDPRESAPLHLRIEGACPMWHWPLARWKVPEEDGESGLPHGQRISGWGGYAQFRQLNAPSCIRVLP